jgi:hypothetical protein
LSNIRRHGIDFADLIRFFEGDLLTIEDANANADYGESRYCSVGLVNGVELFVVWTPRGSNCDCPHLISARRAERHEAKAWYTRNAKRN